MCQICGVVCKFTISNLVNFIFILRLKYIYYHLMFGHLGKFMQYFHLDKIISAKHH